MTEEEAEAIREQVRLVFQVAKNHPSTLLAFGREFTPDQFFAATADFVAIGRMWPVYDGESPEDWLARFGREREKAHTEMVDMMMKARILV